MPADFYDFLKHIGKGLFGAAILFGPLLIYRKAKGLPLLVPAEPMKPRDRWVMLLGFLFFIPVTLVAWKEDMPMHAAFFLLCALGSLACFIFFPKILKSSQTSESNNGTGAIHEQ